MLAWLIDWLTMIRCSHFFPRLATWHWYLQWRFFFILNHNHCAFNCGCREFKSVEFSDQLNGHQFLTITDNLKTATDKARSLMGHSNLKKWHGMLWQESEEPNGSLSIKIETTKKDYNFSNFGKKAALLSQRPSSFLDRILWRMKPSRFSAPMTWLAASEMSCMPLSTDCVWQG